MAQVQQLKTSEPRVIDPNSPLEKQWEILMALTDNPPENSRIITFSVELAQRVLLDLNDGNRKMRPKKIAQMANDLRHDRFFLSGDTIKFGKSGRLLDGQNRLRSCIESDRQLRTHVVFGIDDRAFAVFDSGASRTSEDVFGIANIPNHRTAARAARWLFILEDWERNKLKQPDRGMSIDNQTLLTYYQKRLTPSKLMEFATEKAMHGGRAISHGMLAAIIFRKGKENKALVEEFCDDLEHRRANARVLFKKFEAIRKQQGGRMHELQQLTYIVQAIKSYFDNTRLTQNGLKWIEDHDFPSLN